MLVYWLVVGSFGWDDGWLLASWVGGWVGGSAGWLTAGWMDVMWEGVAGWVLDSRWSACGLLPWLVRSLAGEWDVIGWSAGWLVGFAGGRVGGEVV